MTAPDKPKSEVEAVFNQIALALAGWPVEVGWEAVNDYFASLIALVANDRAHADELADAIAGDLKRTLERNWEFYKSSAAVKLTGPAGHA